MVQHWHQDSGERRVDELALQVVARQVRRQGCSRQVRLPRLHRQGRFQVFPERCEPTYAERKSVVLHRPVDGVVDQPFYVELVNVASPLTLAVDPIFCGAQPRRFGPGVLTVRCASTISRGTDLGPVHPWPRRPSRLL